MVGDLCIFWAVVLGRGLRARKKSKEQVEVAKPLQKFTGAWVTKPAAGKSPLV
jgi:hypothetical protein